MRLSQLCIKILHHDSVSMIISCFPLLVEDFVIGLLSSHQPLLHEVPFLCYVVYKEPLPFLSASILRRFDLLGSEQRYCASLIFIPLLLGVPNPNPEKCVPAQASLWRSRKLSSQSRLSFFFLFWFLVVWCEPRTCCPVLIRYFAL